MPNCLLSDRNVAFLLYEVFEVDRLCELPSFREHSRETFDLYLDACRKLARDVLLPAYKPLDEAPPRLIDGRVIVHPVLKAIYPKLVELGVVNATRPESVGGQQLPSTVAGLATAYLMAANLSAYATVAKERKAPGAENAAFYEGKLCAAQYFIRTELPRIDLLTELCRSGEDSYARVQPGWL